MANAFAKTETATTVTGITLELTLEEAQTLADVLYRVGGSPFTSRRKHTSSILSAMEGASVYAGDDMEVDGPATPTDINKSIYFNDLENKDDG